MPSPSLTLQFFKHGGIHFITGGSKIRIGVHNQCHLMGWRGIEETLHCIWPNSGAGRNNHAVSSATQGELLLMHSGHPEGQQSEAGSVGKGLSGKGGVLFLTVFSSLNLEILWRGVCVLRLGDLLASQADFGCGKFFTVSQALFLFSVCIRRYGGGSLFFFLQKNCFLMCNANGWTALLPSTRMAGLGIQT